jgi:two-component system NtrC family sensor kinase
MEVVKQNPKVLFVDDEESILSAARRLFRGKQIDVITTSSPSEGLRILSKENIWVVVSDQRMPEMTGTEFLEKVKALAPHTTRILLTGFLELPIIQEAINKASVFRFVTKPWNETELVLGVETAILHSSHARTNLKLVHEVGAQNNRLELFTKNLESEVLKRTQGIEESKQLAEVKQRLVRDLTGFVKSLSRVNDASQLFEVLHHEMRKFKGVSNPSLVLLDSSGNGTLFWYQSRSLREKHVSQLPKHFSTLSVRTSYFDDRKWWTSVFKRPCHDLVAIPIRARDTGSPHAVAILFVEHQFNSEDLIDFLDRVTERLQPVSIVLDKILLREQLVSATQQWEGTFNGFRDPIAIVDHQERVIRANKKFFKAGVKRCHEMLDDRLDLCLGCPMPAAIASETPTSGIIKTSGGKTYRVHSYPVVNSTSEKENVARVVNHYNDITTEKDLYLKLVQSEKLAAVGLLAGNIAHELNNPLSGIRSLSQILQTEIPSTSSHAADLLEIEKAAIRCHQIIKNLLNFSEPSGDQVERIDINELISSTMPLLKTAVRNVNLHMHLDKKPVFVNVQPSQLQQVMFNLINNACQAMSVGGTLELKSWSEGSMGCFSVRDTGPGISEELQKRVFEPFFTTKDAGSGTGLGLSVSRSIIENYKGELSLTSVVGQGTIFKVMLPLVFKVLN